MDDDLELARLRALNARIEVLMNARGDVPDAAEDAAIEALELEAADILETRAERRLAPIRERFDRAMVEARRLLGKEP